MTEAKNTKTRQISIRYRCHDSRPDHQTHHIEHSQPTAPSSASRQPNPASLAAFRHRTSPFADEDLELDLLPGPSIPYPGQQEEEQREKEQDRLRREKLHWLLQKAEMKFSHSLQFNAVPDWSSHYIAYSNLKKLYVIC